MNASTDLSIITLVLNASLVVKSVLAVLLAASLMSWMTIFSKGLVLGRAMRQTRLFEERFWSGGSLAKLYESATQQRSRTGALERIFASGMAEFLKLNGRGRDEVLSSVHRGMSAAYQREFDDLERGLPLLASIGSVSPYVGLFGTVWGIMDAFTGLATLENVSLAVVAPGIAEALIATAIGLFAAIPATASYNYFANRLERLSNRFESFCEEFENILARQS
ncbi:MAG: protein TolQ [Duodenibacillus sp.]|nr:protein TolQ [Duodenibacillus sp.]